MTVQPSQQPDGVPGGPAATLYDTGNPMLMIRNVQLVTGIFTDDAGNRFAIVTLRDQGTTFTVYLPSQALSDWRKVLDQLQRDLDAATGRGLIIPGVQRPPGLNGHGRPQGT